MTQSRRLRNDATIPERLLWPLLRTFEGVHFRRQVPIGPYIADFACHHPKLVIEVDGATHFTESGLARDDHRDAFLATAGYQVLHLPANDVRTNRTASGN